MRYVVMSRQAKMPASCYGMGRYLRHAVMAVDDDYGRREPPMISDRCRGARVVTVWGPLHTGDTSRSYGYRVRAALERAAEALNAGVLAPVEEVVDDYVYDLV